MFSKAVEIFISELTMRAWQHTEESKRRTIQVFKLRVYVFDRITILPHGIYGRLLTCVNSIFNVLYPCNPCISSMDVIIVGMVVQLLAV